MPDQNDQDQDKNTPREGVDPKSFLLPKKDGPSVDSAQRVQAGALLAQEQNASLPKPAPAPNPAPAAPAMPEEKPLVRPLETYQGDIESVVKKKDVSVVSIAAAEADRRAQEVHASGLAGETPLWRRIAYWGGGAVLILAAVGLAAYWATRQTTTAVIPLDTNAPFISVDDTEALQIAPGTRDSLMSQLNAARKNISLSLGLVERLYLAKSSQDAAGKEVQSEMSVQDLLHVLAPYTPEALLRTLQPTYLLGVHSYDEPEVFLILSTDSYETAYAAMLQWESAMQQDLSPLFSRTPPVHANNTATSSASPSVISGTFVDRVVDNRDARVIQNQYGDILLLWTFLDRNTIVVTTNEFTLREIIARATVAPNLNLPQ